MPDVSDDDRERVVAILREQAAEGRLDMEEFGGRLDEAYAAVTMTDLEHALRDLPVPSLRQRQASAPGATTSRRPDRPYRQTYPPRPGPPAMARHQHPMAHPKGAVVRKAMWHAHLWSYAAVNLMLVVIWALTTPGGYFWPVWPMMGWGLGLAMHGIGEVTARQKHPDQTQ